jgi:hypothetical protein
MGLRSIRLETRDACTICESEPDAMPAASCAIALRSATSGCSGYCMQKAAVELFACQDGKVGLTVRCEDTFGNEHTILHRFWTNAKCDQPRDVGATHNSQLHEAHSDHHNGTCDGWCRSRMYLLEGLESVLRVYKVQCNCSSTNHSQQALHFKTTTSAVVQKASQVSGILQVSPGDVLLFGRMPSGKMVVCARLPGPGDVQRTRRSANANGTTHDKPAKVWHYCIVYIRSSIELMMHTCTTTRRAARILPPAMCVLRGCTLEHTTPAPKGSPRQCSCRSITTCRQSS